MISMPPGLADFSIAISTYNDRIQRAVSLATTLEGIGRVIIVHQVTQDCAIPELPETVRYLRLQGRGVAKSRNAALAEAGSRYLWFLDDDVAVDAGRATAFIQQWLTTSNAVDVVTVGVLDENGHPRKKFPARARRHNLISILSVGTIEIIVDRERVMAKGCLFPNDMGAGSELPVADEPVFLANCLKAGLNVHFHPAYFVSHPSESSGGQFGNAKASRARGVAFRRIYGLVAGGTLLTAMYLRNVVIGTIPARAFLAGYQNALQGLLRNG